MKRKPAKIRASRRIGPLQKGERVQFHEVPINRTPHPYWRNAGSDQR